MTSEQICAIISDIFPFSLFGPLAPYVFFGFIFFLFFLLIKFHASVKKKQEVALEWENFAMACKRRGLNEEEYSTALMLLTASSVKTSPMKFLSSSDIFEQIVSDVLRMIKTGLIPEPKGLIASLKEIRTKLHFDGRKGEPLKSTREIRGGQRLDISIPSIGIIMHGVVSNNDDAQLRIMLDRPLDEEHRQGSGTMQSDVSFVIDNDARYHFSARVTGAGSSFIALEHPEEISREQHREHFRYKIETKVRILRAKAEDETIFLGTRPDFEEAKAGDIINLQSTDISGGGMRVSTNEIFNIGEHLYINFQLSGRQYNIPCEVVDKKPGNYASVHYGRKFVGLSNVEREGIIRHINSRERSSLTRRGFEN